MPRKKTKSATFYVTTSIPYINGEPHLGHAMEFIMADVLARYARQQSKDTLLSIGTDEHGGKVAEKANELGITLKVPDSIDFFISGTYLLSRKK